MSKPIPFLNTRNALLFGVVLYMVFTMGVMVGASPESTPGERLSYDEMNINWSNTSETQYDDPMLPNQIEQPMEDTLPGGEGPPPEFLQVFVESMIRSAVYTGNFGITVGESLPGWIPYSLVHYPLLISSYAALGGALYVQVNFWRKLYR